MSKALLIIVAAMLPVFGCSDEKPAPVATPRAYSAAHLIGGEFTLQDAVSGKTVTRESYQGKVRLVFFGFTHCRMICPLGLNTMQRTLDELDDDAAEVVPLFITTDPKRDTAEIMAEYVAHFDDRIQGLVGSKAAVDAAMKSFRTEAQKTDVVNEHDYQMDHPTIFFLMGRNGEYLQTLSSREKPEKLAEVLRGYL